MERKSSKGWKYTLASLLFKGSLIFVFLSTVCGEEWVNELRIYALYLFIPAFALFTLHIDEESRKCK